MILITRNSTNTVRFPSVELQGLDFAVVRITSPTYTTVFAPFVGDSPAYKLFEFTESGTPDPINGVIHLDAGKSTFELYSLNAFATDLTDLVPLKVEVACVS